MSDRYADRKAQEATHVIPQGVVHLHFVSRNGNEYWKVATKGSHVCKVPNRCVIADVRYSEFRDTNGNH